MTRNFLIHPYPTREILLEDSCFGISLQWFAAEDEGRTEDPTEQKIRKAREEGKVAKSADLTAALVLIFSITALGILGSYWLTTFKDMLTFYLSRTGEVDVTSTGILFHAFRQYYTRLVLPIFGAAFFAALAGNALQVGLFFSTKPITPNFSKITPRFGKWFQRSFASGEAAFNLMKSIVKVIIIAFIAFLTIRSRLQDLVGLINSTFPMAVTTIAGTAFQIMLEASIAMLLFSLADYFFQRRQHRESLKMTKQEVKEERKQSDGDPLVRSRLRERMRAILSENMIRKVPEADVVVTNPTHFAVALQYSPGGKMPAPMVVAKGQDNQAFLIKEIASNGGVPIVENKPLARALYSEVEIGDVIPEKYYEVMATIIKEVFTMRGRGLEAV